MGLASIASRIEELCAVDGAAFDRQVRAEGERLKDALEAGSFDGHAPAVGLEHELYCTDGNGALAPVPRDALECIGTEKEVGRHQIEFHTSPQPLCADTLDAQERELRTRLDSVEADALPPDRRLVSDGMWTISPEGGDAAAYLTDSVDVDGRSIAANMTDVARYHAQSAVYDAALTIDAPHVSLDGDTVLLNSLTTSIQPHYLVPEAAALPDHFAYALRIAGPVLALGVNSPFFPPELYDDVPAEDVLAEAHMENRIGVFESVMNPVDGPPKVRFPKDVDSPAEAVDRIVEARTTCPTDSAGEGASSEYPYFQYKHGSHWCWVRPVFDGTEPRNVRIEFRPLPSQPTVRDTVSFLALVAGLLSSLPHREHPVRELDWETARDNFYAAARDGLRADFEWIDANGRRTTDTDDVMADLFTHARDGLERRGVPDETIARFLQPLRTRWEHRLTPARWKHDVAAQRVDEGVPLADAIRDAQTRYDRWHWTSLLDGDFADWLATGTKRPARPPGEPAGPPTE